MFSIFSIFFNLINIIGSFSGKYIKMTANDIKNLPNQPVTELAIGVVRQDNVSSIGYYFLVETFKNLTTGKVHQENIPGGATHNYRVPLTTNTTLGRRFINIYLRGGWVSTSTAQIVACLGHQTKCIWSAQPSGDNELRLTIDPTDSRLPNNTAILYVRIIASSDILYDVYDIVAYESKNFQGIFS